MIVKNCPSCVGGFGCSSPNFKEKECSKVPNCIMKQIVTALQSRTPEDNEKILNILEVENGNNKHNCIFCGEPEIKTRHFTQAKQLELIKWILINKNKQYLHFVDIVSSYFRGLKFETEEEKIKFIDSEYPQKLAKLVCELWEDLSDEQREEIKEILK